MLREKMSEGNKWKEMKVESDSVDKGPEPWVEYKDPFGRIKVMRESQAIKRKEMDMKWQSIKTAKSENGSFGIKPPTILSDQQAETNPISPYDSPSDPAFHLYLQDRRRHSLNTRLQAVRQNITGRLQVLYYPPPSTFPSSSLRRNSSDSNLFRQDLVEFQQYVIDSIITSDSRELLQR